MASAALGTGGRAGRGGATFDMGPLPGVVVTLETDPGCCSATALEVLGDASPMAELALAGVFSETAKS